MEKIKKVSTKMTYYIVYDVFVRELHLRGGELNVFAAIYSAVAHMNGYISLTMLCRQTGISEPRVCEILKSLENRGLIARASVGYRRKNRYNISGVNIGAKGFPILCKGGESTTPELRVGENKTEQNHSDNKRITTSKRLLPKVNNL